MTNNLKNYINKNSLTILRPSLISLFAYINTEYKLYKQQLIESINEKENTLVTRFDNKDKYIFQNKIDQKYSDINIEIFNNIDKINSSRNYTQNIKIANNYLAKHKAYEYIIDNSSKKIYNSIENILINIIKINTLKLNNTNLDSIKFYTQRLEFDFITIKQIEKDTLILSYFPNDNKIINQKDIDIITEKISTIKLIYYTLTLIIIPILILAIFTYIKKGYYKLDQ